MARIIDRIIGKDQELLDAARNGKVDVIERIVAKRSRNTISIVGSLLKNANVNCVDREGYTPVHLAALHGHRKAIEILLAAEAEANTANINGCTPLHLAAWKGYHEICNLLLSNEHSTVSVNLQDSNGDTAMHFACQYGNAEVIPVLTKYNADPAIRNLKEESPLDLAAQYGRLEVVKLLLDQFADLSQKTIINQSPLHLAAQRGHKQVLLALLDAGFDINTKTDKGTALHVSVLYCKIEVVQLLLDRGIDIGEVDRQGLTALNIARQSEHIQKTSLEIVQIINDHIQKKNEEECQPDPEPLIDYRTLSAFSGQSVDPTLLVPPANRIIEDVYARPQKSDKVTQDKSDSDESPSEEPPPIPPRSESFLLEQQEKKPMAPFQPKAYSPHKSHRHSSVLPQQSTLDETTKRFLPRQPSLPDINHMGSISPESVRKLIKEEDESDGQTGSYMNVQGIVRKGDDDEPPPPPPCVGEEGSHANISGVFSFKDLKTDTPKPAPRQTKLTPPAKPARVKRSSPNASPLPVRQSPPKDNYMRMNEASRMKGQEGYMQMADVQREEKSEEQENYTPMEEIKNKRKDSANENVESVTAERISKRASYVPMSIEEKRAISGEIDCYDMHGALTKASTLNNNVPQQTESPPLPLPVSNNDASSSDEEYAENYENSAAISEKMSAAETSDLDSRESVHNIPLPLIPVKLQDNSSDEDIPVTKITNSQMKKRESFYDNVDHENNVMSSPVSKTQSKSVDNSSCDVKNICDNESVVIKPLEEHSEKRLSNGIAHHDEEVVDTAPKENKVPKPPSLEFEKKRIMKEVQPLTPTGYQQCPTPDFPPPSPNTAMQGIQEKIADIDNKRQSRDMETITEADLLKSPDAPPLEDVSRVGAQSKVSGESKEIKTEEEEEEEPVVVMRRSRIGSAGDTSSRIKSSSSSSSQEDLVKSDELGSLAGLLRGSAPGKPRRIVSQIYDNVRYQRMRANKGKSLPPGVMTSTFDPLMEREEDIDKRMKDAIPAIRNSMNSGGDQDSSFDDNAEWDQIAGILSSCGEDMSQFSDLSSLEAEIQKLLEGATKIQSVGEWLEDMNLDRYENIFITNGYNDTDFLGGKIVEDGDLEFIGIKDADHRKKILDATKLLPDVKPIEPDNPPASVEQWLNSINLPEYLPTFIDHKRNTMESVLQLWEVELHNVLGISQIGHRKRILASLGERQPPDRQYPSLTKRIQTNSSEEKSPFPDVNLFKDYTNVKPLTSSEEDVNSKTSPHAFPPVDSSEDEDVFKSEKQGMNIRDNSIHLRPPHQSTMTSPIKEWRHPPGTLIKGCCNYTAQYLGSTLVKELTGTSSTIEGISKLKKSADVIAKIPVIMLSISYKGVKFIDAKSKKVICDHEIGNIFCACQDADSMNFFAYITRDNNNGKHYCHVFNVRNVDHAREIILTLGEAFEVAYQMALKEKASAGAMEFERQMSQSDVEADSISISSKASISTV